MPNILLHGAPGGSPYVRKVQIALAEKGLAYEHVPTIPVAEPPSDAPFPGITPAVRDHTPLGKIPFARIDGRWLADSSVIIAYLDRLYPDPPMFPTDAWDYARALWFEEYIDGGAVPRLFNTIYFERLIAPALMGRPIDQSVVDHATMVELPQIYAYLDGQIGSRAFLAGEQFSIADAACASFARSMQQAGAGPDSDRFPQLARYVAQQLARPSIARLIDQEESISRGLQLERTHELS